MKEIYNILEENKDKMIKFNKKEIQSDCYILINHLSNKIDFDPLKDYDIKPESKGYTKSLICLDKNDIKITFNEIKEEIKIIINKNKIKNIFILPNMKKIIHYNKKYKNEKINNIQILLSEEKLKDNNNIEDFDELLKCIYNKYFCLSIVLSNNKKINIIFLNYETFKTWLKIFDKFCENNS